MGYKDTLLKTMLGWMILAASGCSEGEPVETVLPSGGQGYLAIGGASVEESSTASAADFTRADGFTRTDGTALGRTTTDDTLPEEIVLEQPTDQIGIFLQADPDKGYAEAITNKMYAYGVPIWTSEPHLMLGEQSAQLAAYYPYDADGIAPKKVTLTSGTYAADKEFYYLPFRASRISSSFHLKLRRAYSLVRFNLFVGEEDADAGKGAYTGDGQVTAFAFTAPLTSTGTLNLFTGEVTAVNTNVSFAANGTFTAGTPAAPYVLDFLIVPTNLSHLAEDASKVNFTLTVDGKEMKGSLTATAFFGADRKLAEGVKYEANIVIRPTGLEVGTLRVQDWDVVTTETDKPLENK